MIRRIPPAARRWLGQWFALVVFYLFVELVTLATPQPHEIGRWILGVAAVFWGVRRVAAFHPWYNGDYRRWLGQTPWTSRKPLPMGPVVPTWGDGLYLATILLLSTIAPEPGLLRYVALFVIGHVAAIVPTIRKEDAPIRAVTIAGLGLAVRHFYSPPVCLAAGVAVYLLAYQGLRRSLDRFAETPEPYRLSHENVTGDPLVDQLNAVGWPYGPMLVDTQDTRPWPRLDTAILCLLVAWWIDCLAALFVDPQRRLAFLALVSSIFELFTLLRLGAYVQGCAPPISFWGRIRTMRLIIPGYDRIWVGTICGLLAGPMTVALLAGLGAPMEARLSAACGMVLLVLILTPPSLRRWRLTGAYRLDPMKARQAGKQFIQAG